MNRCSLVLLAVISCIAVTAQAVDFWHSSTIWAGRGQCSAKFSIDSEMQKIENLQITVSAINKVGEKVATGLLEVQQFGQSNADRYASAFLEGEEICAEDLVIVVDKAVGIVNGKRTDLLKSKSISARDFKPFEIRIVK
jgi:hypothetical protein